MDWSASRVGDCRPPPYPVKQWQQCPVVARSVTQGLAAPGRAMSAMSAKGGDSHSSERIAGDSLASSRQHIHASSFHLTYRLVQDRHGLSRQQTSVTPKLAADWLGMSRSVLAASHRCGQSIYVALQQAVECRGWAASPGSGWPRLGTPQRVEPVAPGDPRSGPACCGQPRIASNPEHSLGWLRITSLIHLTEGIGSKGIAMSRKDHHVVSVWSCRAARGTGGPCQASNGLSRQGL